MTEVQASVAPGFRQIPDFPAMGHILLVHGAGFANYLRDLFVAPIAVPLFGFNVGIELGQLVVLAIAAVALGLLDRGIAALSRPPRPPAGSHLRLRVVAVSALVALVATRWAVERSPW